MDARAVGQRIKAAREKKNMTQEDLAACIDISPTHVSFILSGNGRRKYGFAIRFVFIRILFNF